MQLVHICTHSHQSAAVSYSMMGMLRSISGKISIVTDCVLYTSQSHIMDDWVETENTSCKMNLHDTPARIDLEE